jgi:hypothetical protein
MNTYLNSDIQHVLLVVAPSLITQVCSVVWISPFVAGPFAAHGPVDGPRLALATDQTAHYGGEQFVFHITAEDSDTSLPVDQPNCPTLFLRTRASTGDTLFEQLRPPRTCSAAPNTAATRSKLEMDLDGAATSAGGWLGLGDYAVEVSVIAPRGPGRDEIPMAVSNDLPMHFFDASEEVNWKWGPRDNGVSVALKLDKEVYTLGEMIPLHIAREEVAAPEPIYMGPCDEVFIELRDPNGSRIASVTSSPICTFSGPVGIVRRFPHQQVITKDVRLSGFYSGSRDIGFLPEFEGTYTLVVRWTFRTQNWPGQVCAPDCRATVYSEPVRLRIDDDQHKQLKPSPWPTAPTNDGPGSGSFAQVDTSLGPATALEDKITGLKWLHWDLTANLSYSTLEASMVPGKWLAGWRYATPEELRALFAHFTGSADGKSTDPALAARM